MTQEQINKYFGHSPYLMRIAESRMGKADGYVDIQARAIVHQSVDLVRQLIDLENSVFDIPTHFDYRSIKESINSAVTIATLFSRLVIKEEDKANGNKHDVG